MAPHRTPILLILLCLLPHCALCISRCGTTAKPDLERERALQQRAHAAGLDARGTTVTTIPVIFHVIREDDGTTDVTTAALSQQLCLLNEAFANSNFQFYLEATTETDNSGWTNGCESPAMYLALSTDPDSVMNVYFCQFLNNNVLGFATLGGSGAEGTPADAVVILASTLPGGDAELYDEGDTFIHEVGHYLGLYHTFEGQTCSGEGDLVDDTPTQSEPSSGAINSEGEYTCPVNQDSCPNEPGKDAVTNFMDYSFDCCLSQFSAGQIERMETVTAVARPDLGQGYTDNGDYGSNCPNYDTCPADGSSRLGCFWF